MRYTQSGKKNQDLKFMQETFDSCFVQKLASPVWQLFCHFREDVQKASEKNILEWHNSFDTSPTLLKKILL